MLTRERVIIIILLCVIAGMWAAGGTIEGFGAGLLVGLVLGAMVGAAFVVDRTSESRLDP